MPASSQRFRLRSIAPAPPLQCLPEPRPGPQQLRHQLWRHHRSRTLRTNRPAGSPTRLHGMNFDTGTATVGPNMQAAGAKYWSIRSDQARRPFNAALDRIGDLGTHAVTTGRASPPPTYVGLTVHGAASTSRPRLPERTVRSSRVIDQWSVGKLVPRHTVGVVRDLDPRGVTKGQFISHRVVWQLQAASRAVVCHPSNACFPSISCLRSHRLGTTLRTRERERSQQLDVCVVIGVEFDLRSDVDSPRDPNGPGGRVGGGQQSVLRIAAPAPSMRESR